MRRTRLAAAAAILAIALQSLWPLIAQAKPRVPGELIPVCTVNGITHYLELPTSKTPLEQRSSTHGQHCQLCVFGAERSIALPAPNVVLFSSRENLSEEKASQAVLFLESLGHPPAQPRAPPAVL